MRLLIVSDLHANLAALERVAVQADAVVFLGDAVDYGPDPGAAVDWVRRWATYAVRGNHDEAVARGAPTGAASAWVHLAEASADWTRGMLDANRRAFLAGLPLRTRFKFGGARFEAVHAAPLDPLYRYLPPETTEAEWRRQLENVEADWLLLGHTHRPFVARFGRTTVLNPGSVGQSRSGVPFASWAVWEDGDVHLVGRRYDVERTVRRLTSTPLDRPDVDELAEVLRTGRTRGRAPTSAAGRTGDVRARRLTGVVTLMESGIEVERKWLVRRAPPTAILRDLAARPLRIEQVYLTPAPGAPVRRVRRILDGGVLRHVYTEKRALSSVAREERERAIDEPEYEHLLAEADPELRAIRKVRYVFDYAGRTLELDVFRRPRGLVLLEIEIDSPDAPDPALPPQFDIVAEVTEDPAYLNVNLARPEPAARRS